MILLWKSPRVTERIKHEQPFRIRLYLMDLLNKPLMSHLPLVSVIIPAYNAAAFIRQTLVSVLSQSYRNLEIIVVDDGSTDQTAEIVKSIAKSDHRLILLRQSNQGVAVARNLAIEKSRGEFIAPIDADDIWHPEKIKKQVKCMLESGPAVGLVYTWFMRIDENSLYLCASGKWEVEGMALTALIYSNFVGNGSVPLIRRACLEHVGGYTVQLRAQGAEGCEDWDLYLRIAEHYRFRVVPAYLVGYRRSSKNMSSNYIAMAKSHKVVLQNIEQRHSEISAEIFRGAKSTQCFFEVRAHYSRGNYLGALYWAYHALLWDSMKIFSKPLLNWTVLSLLEIMAKPVTSLIGLEHRPLLEFIKRIRSRFQKNRTLIPLENGYEIMPQTRKPLNVYDRYFSKDGAILQSTQL